MEQAKESLNVSTSKMDYQQVLLCHDKNNKSGAKMAFNSKYRNIFKETIISHKIQ